MLYKIYSLALQFELFHNFSKSCVPNQYTSIFFRNSKFVFTASNIHNQIFSSFNTVSTIVIHKVNNKVLYVL